MLTRYRYFLSMATPKMWMRLASISGSTSVAAAAYGAHKMNGKTEMLKTTYNNGNKLHMVHSFALLAGASSTAAMRVPAVSLALFSFGIAAFSGSC